MHIRVILPVRSEVAGRAAAGMPGLAPGRTAYMPPPAKDRRA